GEVGSRGRADARARDGQRAFCPADPRLHVKSVSGQPARDCAAMLEAYERLGLVYAPTGAPWHLSHCQNPFVQQLSSSRFLVHFGCRDDKNRSRGGWAEVEQSNGRLAVVRAAQSPSLDLGRLGAFDDCGAMPGTLVEHDGRLLLYYTGWT